MDEEAADVLCGEIGERGAAVAFAPGHKDGEFGLVELAGSRCEATRFTVQMEQLQRVADLVNPSLHDGCSPFRERGDTATCRDWKANYLLHLVEGWRCGESNTGPREYEADSS